MRSMLKGAIPDDLKDFGKILTDLSKNDQAKSTFLLATLPTYYNQLIQIIQMKTVWRHNHTPQDICPRSTEGKKERARR